MNNYNLIVNFGGQPWQISYLQERIGSNNVRVLNLSEEDLKKDPSNEVKDSLKKIDKYSRIYIIDHARPNSTEISSAHYQLLGDFFGKNLSDIELHNSDSQLKFSLIACNAGSGEKQNLESFAGLFHRYLGQNYQIYHEVVARTKIVRISPEMRESGKLTATLMQYALIIIAFEKGLKINLGGHKLPGSKISFQWDEHGNERVVDSYVDKYFNSNIKLLTDIDSFCKYLDKDFVQKYNEIKLKLLPLIFDKNIEVQKVVKKINSNLEEIKNLVKDTDILELKEKVEKNINKILLLSKKSISKSSFQSVQSKINILDTPFNKEKPIQQKVKETIISPAIEALKELPKSNDLKEIKKNARDLLQFLSDISTEKLMKEESCEHEQMISGQMTMLLYTLNNVATSKEKKIETIEKIKKLFEEEIALQLLYSPKVTGAIEGYNEAARYGGLTTLQTVYSLVSHRAHQKSNDIENIKNLLENFIFSCIEYVNNK